MKCTTCKSEVDELDAVPVRGAPGPPRVLCRDCAGKWLPAAARRDPSAAPTTPAAAKPEPFARTTLTRTSLLPPPEENAETLDAITPEKAPSAKERWAARRAERRAAKAARKRPSYSDSMPVGVPNLTPARASSASQSNWVAGCILGAVGAAIGTLGWYEAVVQTN